MFILTILTLINIAVDAAAAIQVNTGSLQVGIEPETNDQTELVEKENDEMKAAHKAYFQKFIDSLNLETSYIVTRQKHDKIIQYLTNQVTKPEPKFKHYVFKQNEFSLVNGILHKKV